MLRKLIVTCCLVLTGAAGAHSQVMVEGTATLSVPDMVTQVFIDNSTSIDVANVQHTGNAAQFGVFTTQPGTFPFAQGIIMSTGNAAAVTGDSLGAFLTPLAPITFASTAYNGSSNPLLNALGGGSQAFDAATISFDFVPRNDTVFFRYVFASEEYPEFVQVGNPNGFNDIFGLFIQGPGYAQPTNMALLPGSSTPVSINNVNDQLNSQYYQDGATLNFLYNGFTVVLEAKAPVQPCQTYTLTLAIQDVGDGIFDSAIFLEALSFNAGNLSHVNLIADDSLAVCDSLVALGTAYVAPQYDWSPATGLSNPTAPNPVATYSQPIQYVLQATLSPTCILRDSIALHSGPQAWLTVGATDDQGAPLAGGTAFTIEWDTLSQSLSLLGSAPLAGGSAGLVAGYAGFRFAKAAPDSAIHPNLLPTYYGNALFVQNATPLPALGCGDSLGVGISCLVGQNPGGPGFISGFISQGANKTSSDPVVGLPVFAMDAAGQPLAYRITDGAGYFAFSNLPAAPTSLYVDYWGVQNSLAPSLPLSASLPTLANQQFVLHSSYLEWASTSSSPEAASGSALALYPNPTQGALAVRTTSSGPVLWQVVDATGRAVAQGTSPQPTFTLGLAHLAPGTYALHIQTTQGCVAQRFVISR